MRIAGYTWGANVKGKLLPYEASIRSMLMLADEVWVAYDQRYDVAETFTSIDDRVHVVSYPFHISKITGAGEQLSRARMQCVADWLIWLDLDEVLHHKDAGRLKSLVEYADLHGFESVGLSVYSYLSKRYTFGQNAAFQWGIRPKLLKNIDGLTHGIPVDAYKEREDGTQYLGYGDGVDFVKDGLIYPHRNLEFRDYPFLQAVSTGEIAVDDILRTTKEFPHIYHYSRYSMQRKGKMQTHEFAEYFQGNSDEYNPEEWGRKLAEAIELVPIDDHIDEEWIGPVCPEHPRFILDWVKMIDEKSALQGGH